MRNTIIKAIYKAAKKNKNILFLTADLGYSVIENFQKELPNQVINVGIAEQNMISLAAGLALVGKKVFVYSIIPFVTMRCFEQIRVDVCYQNLDVNIIGVGGGYAYGTLGGTHHAIEDVAIMRALPNMKIIAPADPLEAEILIQDILKNKGPFYIRLNRGGELKLFSGKENIGLNKNVCIKNTGDIAIFSTGAILEEVLKANVLLKEKKIKAKIISISTLKLMNEKAILNKLKNCKLVISIEEHNVIGGLGSILAEIIAKNNLNIKLKSLGINDEYIKIVGKQDYLRDFVGLSAVKIATQVYNVYNKIG